MDEFQEILQDFLVESFELVEKLADAVIDIPLKNGL